MAYCSATTEIMYAALDFALAMLSNLGPEFRPGIFRVNLAKFPQQFPRALVAWIRRLDRHFDDLVAALIRPEVEHALLAQPEFLAVLGALRNLQQRPAVDRRNLDLRA